MREAGSETIRPFSRGSHKTLASAFKALYNPRTRVFSGDLMKATIERATLLKGLGHVHSVVERRNTIPILSNVLIEGAAGGGIRLMATDLDLQINETLEANVSDAGATTVPAHTLFDIVRKLPEGSQVELNAAEGRMQINAGRARFTLAALPRDDFPVIAEGELPVRFELPAATLRQIIDKTRFAISSEETRYYLNGIYLHVTDGELKAAATDGHRLARVTVERPDGAETMPGLTHPRNAWPNCASFSTRSKARSKSRCPKARSASAGQCGADVQLIDGTFGLHAVIPTANDKLLRSIPAASSRRRPRFNDRQRAHPRRQDDAGPRPGDSLRYFAENGTAAEEVAADYAAAGIEIGFNAAICSTSSTRSRATRSKSTSPTPPPHAAARE
jgi:DNA polymerase-3 subunit beta